MTEQSERGRVADSGTGVGVASYLGLLLRASPDRLRLSP
jgi:hypothetical protein